MFNQFKLYRLEPILQRIKEKKTAIVCPSIDTISAENMAYHGGEEIGSIGIIC